VLPHTHFHIKHRPHLVPRAGFLKKFLKFSRSALMIKQQFEPVNLRKASLNKLDKINSIIEEYQAQGYSLTLRQLYYQLVSRNLIANTQKEYANLGNLLTKGRMMGLVDWDAIEDRGREYLIMLMVYLMHFLIWRISTG
jgi:hypothetical protein